MGKKSSQSEVVDVNHCKVSLKPLLMRFEHGVLKEEEVANLKCKLMKNDVPNKYMLVVNNDAEEFKYNAHTIDENAQLCQKFFIIRNKRTNKIRLASVDQISLSRYFGDTSFENTQPNIQTQVSQTPSRAEFIEAFGSKAALKRNYQLDETNDKLTDYHSKLEETIKGSEVDLSPVSHSPRKLDSVCIPVVNENATCVEELFPLENLFRSKEVLESLEEVANDIIQNRPTTPDKEFSKFFIATINRIVKLGITLTTNHVKGALYADAIFRYLQIEARKLSNTTELFQICPVSKAIRNIIISEFAIKSPGSTRISRPLTMKAKGICYILILLITVFGFRLEMEFAFNHLEPLTTQRRLKESAKAIGFSIGGVRSHWILPFPYKSPQKTTGKKRKLV